MSSRSFRSVFMVGAVASAALGCYLVSLRVASERAALESVETRIVLAQRDIRMLETEIGTRGRLAQLERWNVRAIQLSAPTADQFMDNGFQLATMIKPERKPALETPVVLASAPVGHAPQRPATTSDRDNSPPPAIGSEPAGDLMHIASYSRPTAAPARVTAIEQPVPPAAATTPRKSATKPAKTATADPLAPLSGAARDAKAGGGSKRNSKDSGTP